MSTDKAIAEQVNMGLERGHFLTSQAGKVGRLAEAIYQVSPDKGKRTAVGEAGLIVGEMGGVDKYIKFFQEELEGHVTVRQRMGLERDIERLEAVKAAMGKKSD